jgi:Flp pilus assembly protein TadD
MAKRKTSRKGIAPKARDKGGGSRRTVPASQPRGSILLISLSLVVATLVVFWPLAHFQFINLDDNEYVHANPQVKAGLTVKGLIWAFTTTHAGNWHPLTWLSHMADCELYGLNAGGHHVTNVLLHLANTLLLFLVLERMTRARWASSFVAALFALHPLHVESVAWVAERKDVLSAFFWMLTLWTYVRYTGGRTLNRYLVALFSFALGLLSKAMLVTLPCVMLLLDYWPLGRLQLAQPGGHRNGDDRSGKGNDQRSFTRRIILEKVPFFALAALSSLVTFFAQQSGGAVSSLESIPLGTRVANALVSYLSYMGKMIWPRSLAVLYPHPGMVPMWQAAAAVSLLAAVTVLVVRFARRYPYLAVGWLWYLGTLVPVIGLVQVGAQAMADRYTYVPLIGLFIMIAWGIPDMLAGWRHRKTVLVISAGVVLSIFMVVTRLQIQLWHDSIALFKHTLAVTARNAIIQNNLGIVLTHQGRQEEAIAHYMQALRIRPQDPDAHINLGNALASRGRQEEAVAHYMETLRIDPRDAEAHNNLGIALARQGRQEEAIAHYMEALRIDPQYAEAHYNLANLLARQGRQEEAIAHYMEALRIDPRDAEAHYNLANLLARQGRQEEADAHFAEARRIKAEGR